MVNQYERAYRAWQVLTEAAAGHKPVTYGQLARTLSMHHRPLRYVLSLIQDHCLDEKLPPLTILVVNQSTKRPGEGFIAWDANDVEEGQRKVFNCPWHLMHNPFEFASDGQSFDDLVTTLTLSPEKSTDVYTKVRVRGVAQKLFRDALLLTYNYECAFTSFSFQDCLDAAHIVSWADSTPAQRMDVRNGILLSAIHHRLFDQGRITIDEDYRIRFYDPKMQDAPPYSECDRLLTASLNGKAMRLPASRERWPKLEWVQQRNAGLEWEFS